MRRIRSMFSKFGKPKASKKLSFDDLIGFQRVRNVTFEEWLECPEELKRLLVKAASMVDAERAALTGYASLSPEACAEVSSHYDGGALHRKIELTKAAYAALMENA